MADQLKGAASGVTNTVSSGANKASSAAQPQTSSTSAGTKDWDAMTEEQKKQTFDSLPSDKKQGLSYTEWIKQGYQHQKENWMPWIEDMYLKWFTNDNKASYATKGRRASDGGTTWFDRLTDQCCRSHGQDQSHRHRAGRHRPGLRQ